MRKSVYLFSLLLVAAIFLASCTTVESSDTVSSYTPEERELEVPDYKFKEKAEPPVPGKENVTPMFVPSGDTMPGGESMMPLRSLFVLTPEDLGNGIYEIVGTVEGKGRVNADNPEDGDTHMYGRLVENEGSAMDSISMEGIDPYDVSLANAIADMIQDAWSKGAAFVVFPSYVVDFTDDRYIETTVKAVGVGLVPAVAD